MAIRGGYSVLYSREHCSNGSLNYILLRKQIQTILS